MSTVAIWDTPLSAGEVSTLGLVGDRFFTQKVASNPTPAEGADDVLITTDLAWTPGEYAATHNVYFDLSWEDVDAAAPETLIAEGLARDANSLDIGRLDFGDTYYWRVDEVNGAPDFDVFQGKVWSFTVEPKAYPIESITVAASSSDDGAGPENTINGSGLGEDDLHSIESSDMWLSRVGGDQPTYIEFAFDRVYKLHEMLVWNYNVSFESVLGFGLKEVTIEYSSDGAEWVVLGDFEFSRATARADYGSNITIDFGGLAVQAVRLTVNSGWGTVAAQYGLSEVRFLYIPVSARQAQPADGAADVDPDTVLSWRAGREAAAHDIYLGGDSDSLDLVDTTDDATFAPPSLLLGRTYYWRVDEVNEAASPTTWEGAVWSFSTKEYVTVDDFESYTDDIDAGEAIFQTWIDGLDNGNGSTVGYFDPPFAEPSIVHSGRQSMPLAYDNSLAPFFSEAERDLGGVYWTVGGADRLRLYVQGTFDNGPGRLYVALEDSVGHVAVVTHPDETLVTADTWREWTIPFDDFSGVNLGAVRMIYVGIGDRDNPASGGTGTVFIDDIAFGRSTE